MKSTIISIAAAALCASALSTQAFAADILSDKSVYANDRESLAVKAGTMNLDDAVISVDPDTIMPYYHASMYDYAKTGKFDIVPYAQWLDENNTADRFVANALNANGEFVGTAVFEVGGSHPGICVFSPSTNKADSIAFEPNARRIKAAMSKQNINSDCKDIKMVFIVGLGTVYYINNGTSEYLAASNFDWINAKIFNDENGGIVEIDDDLKANIERIIAEEKENGTSWDPGENPPEGGTDAPEYIVDNTPYLNDTDVPSTPDNPITGSNAAALAAELGLASAMIIGGMIVRRKRKN